MSVEQLEMFTEARSATPAPSGVPVLNGFYYETCSKKFVCFARGRRHFEVLASICKETKAWQQKIIKERSI
jgi:hypothetical protein